MFSLFRFTKARNRMPRLLLLAFLLQSCYHTTSVFPDPQDDPKKQVPLQSTFKQGTDSPNKKVIQKASQGEIDQLVIQAKAGKQQAFREILTTAQGNDAYAQYTLGVMYKNGWGVAQDYQKAVAWYQEAAKQRQAYAQTNLGAMYQNGLGVDQDYQAAVAWYQEAAKQGQAYAQTNLGMMYQNGLGVDQDSQTAIGWFQKAAEQGQVDAQQALDKLIGYKSTLSWGLFLNRLYLTPQ